jgi:hypothetical protein
MAAQIAELARPVGFESVVGSSLITDSFLFIKSSSGAKNLSNKYTKNLWIILITLLNGTTRK